MTREIHQKDVELQNLKQQLQLQKQQIQQQQEQMHQKDQTSGKNCKKIKDYFTNRNRKFNMFNNSKNK